MGVFKSEQYCSYQPLERKATSSSKQTIEVFISSASFLEGCLLLYLVSFIIGCLLLFSTNKKVRKGLLVTRCLDTLLGFRQAACRRPDSIGILMFSFVIFHLLVQNLIQNNMSSTSVVVDTSFLVTSIKRMFELNYKVCFGESGPETGFFQFAPKSTIPYRIFSQFSPANHTCYMFGRGTFNLSPYPVNTYFGLTYCTTLRIVKGMMLISTQRNAFMHEHSFFEILRTIGIRKNLPEHLRNNIDQCLKFLLEYGLVTEMYKQVEVFFNSKFKNEFRTFSAVNEYEDDNVSVMSLGVQNFRLLFQIYCLLLVAIGSFFVVSRLTQCLTRGCRKQNSKTIQFEHVSWRPKKATPWRLFGEYILDLA